LCDDVVKLKGRADERFGEKAILATEPGAATDSVLKRGVHP